MGFTCHLGEVDSREVLFHTSKKHHVERLFSLTWTRYNGHPLVGVTERQFFKSHDTPGCLKTDVKCGTVLGLEDMKLRVG